MNKLRHFIDTNDLTKEEIYEILELMKMLKKARYNGAVPELLKNKTLAMIFEEPSTRTRISFEAAMTLLGGHAQYLKPGEIHLGVRESIYDTTKVISRMADGIFCRALKHETLLALGKYSDVPVFNGITDYIHPTQAIADVFTMFEHFTQEQLDNLHNVTVTFVGDATNVASSTMYIVTQLGMNFTHIAPKNYQMPKKWVETAQKHVDAWGKKNKITITDDLNAVKGTDIIYTDLWWWVDQVDEAADRYKAFWPHYQVNKELLKKAGPQVKLMHCLPASRGVELSDEVFDGEHSIIFDQSENRLTAQMGLLVYYMYPQIDKSTEEEKKYWKGKIESFMGDKDRSWKARYSYNNDYESPLDYLKDTNIKKKK